MINSEIGYKGKNRTETGKHRAGIVWLNLSNGCLLFKRLDHKKA